MLKLNTSSPPSSTLQKKNGYMQLLVDTPDITATSTWHQSKRLIETDPRYHAVDTDLQRVKWFHEYINILVCGHCWIFHILCGILPYILINQNLIPSKVTYKPIGPGVYYFVVKCIYTCHVNKQITYLLIILLFKNPAKEFNRFLSLGWSSIRRRPVWSEDWKLQVH